MRMLHKILFVLCMLGLLSVFEYSVSVHRPGIQGDGSVVSEHFPEHQSVVLITSFYEEKFVARKVELMNALSQNLRSGCFSAIHVLVEGTTEVGDELSDVEIVPISHQPTYKDFFQYAASVLPGSIVVVQNTDILWDAGTCSGISKINRGTVFALSRHPHPNATADKRCSERQQCFDYNGSHDAFVFISPLPLSVLDATDFRQNLWGAENRLIFELRAAGLLLFNPCKSVLTRHAHCSRKRSTPQERINRAGGGRYDDFYKSGFVASTRLYNPKDARVACQKLQDASYEIAYVDTIPRRLLGKNMSKWMRNMELHIDNQRSWNVMNCSKVFQIDEIRPSERQRDWRAPAALRHLQTLQRLASAALFSHTVDKSTRERAVQNVEKVLKTLPQWGAV
eukprot:TRINITY_DN883_c0_g1_i1.p1 TRINITY_DN883_c0_g1~~TRINITY_DN883_c0_g1_i1.p1  ORF type:complete len:395 (-),score=42.83 TRINITY_DN883_c0_g1_i1:64-1248(-)